MSLSFYQDTIQLRHLAHCALYTLGNFVVSPYLLLMIFFFF